MVEYGLGHTQVRDHLHKGRTISNPTSGPSRSTYLSVYLSTATGDLDFLMMVNCDKIHVIDNTIILCTSPVREIFSIDESSVLCSSFLG